MIDLTLLEVYIKNKNILKTANEINKMLESAISNGANLNDDIVFCKDAFLYYTSTASLNAQTKAPMGEEFLCDILGLSRVSPRENRGDAVDNLGKYYEFKNSFTNQNECLNVRQIRLWQNVDYYYCFYINENDLNESVFFVLTKEEMAQEVALCGGYSHGTIDANILNKNSEYSITIPVYNEENTITKRWKEKYLSIELKNRIFNVNKVA